VSNPAGARRPRSRREWTTDLALFGCAVAYGLFTALWRAGATGMDEPSWLIALDQIVGALGCAGLWLRRRRPTELAVALVLLSVFSETVAGAMLVALFTVAIHRRLAHTLVVFGLSVLTAMAFVVIRPDPDGSPPLLVLMLGVALQSAVVGWGLFIRQRRQLISSLVEKAERAAAEAGLRAEQAQRRARDDIAREIHDVLGHRLSLLSVHAGALEYRPEAPPADIARAAAVIRESAHQALQDLRDVVGVLRAPSDQEQQTPALPQPVLADLPRLVAESRRAGMAVDLVDEVSEPVPEHLGRTVHRIVQEALTNARKHAAGAEVSVRLRGRPGTGIELVVSNGAVPLRVPGTREEPGQGLVGLAERVGLVGGRLAYGPSPEGGWRVEVWLPWPA
jgi:signal transduction histidine kinase